MVDEKDREDYERGRKERNLDPVEEVTRHIFHDKSDSAAWRKGRQGEQLDEDKED